MVQARYNEEKHGIELLFDEKPDQAIRDAIKAAGFRWYKPGGYWYAKQTANTKALAESLANGQIASPMDDYSTAYSDGYMGAVETTGSMYASGKMLYGSELSKAIRQAFKKCGIGGCSGSAHTFSGGQEITVKIKITPKDLMSKDGYIASFDLLRDGGYWFIDSDGQQIHRDYIEWGNAEKTEAIRKATAAARYDWMIKELHGYGVDYHNVDQKAISAALVSKVDAIKRILNAFNHDDSNGMVDYFDTHFYENIRLIAA